MAVSFTNLKLSVNKAVNTFEFNGTKIEVLKYLPIEDKKDLIQVAMQKSYENGLYNDILLDIYFHLNLVYLYTNLNITEKQREDEPKLFDKIESSGLMAAILGAMEESEYEYLRNSLDIAVKNQMKYKNSAAAVLQSIIQDLPANAAAAADIVNGWDPEKFQSVQDMVNLARQTGMNPPLPSVESTDEAPAASSEDKVVSFLEEQAKLEE